MLKSRAVADKQAGARDPAENPAMREQLFASLYRELHRLAGRQLWSGGAAAWMGPTTLVHEAYLNFAGRADIPFENRAHFLTYAASTMRGLIIDRARSASAGKRGGGLGPQRLDTALGERLAEPEQVIGMGPLLDELAEIDADLAQIVDLKFLCGFSFGEIAHMRGCSERTVQRHWEQARLLLQRLAMDGDQSR
ncbi:MAG TPA: ECF-type sigma factor [Steroidobacteraceae bacterium]|jgi:RNA polymerase sigma factor (TIGR02999 family)|nr:ECF-type sigma factor [Steroidobacteraceae bacterium]